MKTRKIPMRKCVVTNEMHPKNELIRIVRSKEGDVSVDPTGKKNGRGSYVMRSTEVIKKAQKNNVLDRHLETKVPDEIYTALLGLVDGEK